MESISAKKKAKRKQAHQNTFAFKHNPSSKLTKKIEAIPVANFCRRCTDKILWKKKYRKYKIQKHLSRCTLCQEKNISTSYNIICEPCGTSKNICRICKLALSPENISLVPGANVSDTNTTDTATNDTSNDTSNDTAQMATNG